MSWLCVFFLGEWVRERTRSRPGLSLLSLGVLLLFLQLLVGVRLLFFVGGSVSPESSTRLLGCVIRGTFSTWVGTTLSREVLISVGWGVFSPLWI